MRQQRDAILLAFGVPDEQVTCGEINVLHAHARTFEQPEPRSVEQFGHEPRHAVHRCQHALDFLSCKHKRQPRLARRTDQAVDPGWFHEQNVAIEENDRAEGLDVRGRTDLPSANQRIEKHAHFFRSELARRTSVKPKRICESIPCKPCRFSD